MAATNLKLHPPIQYDLIWLIIGLCLLAIVLGWCTWMFWSTRRKPIKSLETLEILPEGAEFARLKAKYLKLIDDQAALYRAGKISVRQLQQELSRLVRMFVYEARHFPAPRLTLSDLMLATYPLLTKLIARLYPGEFAPTNSWDGEAAIESAKGYIRQWSS